MLIPRTIRWMAVLGLLVGAAACQPATITAEAPTAVLTTASAGSSTEAEAAGSPATPTGSPAAAETAAPAATPAVTTVPAATPMALAEIISDLAQRQNVTVGSVQVISVEASEMSLPGLSCPSGLGGRSTPGVGPVLPAQVLGQVIRLRANNKDYIYHANGRLFAYCGPA